MPRTTQKGDHGEKTKQEETHTPNETDAEKTPTLLRDGSRLPRDRESGRTRSTTRRWRAKRETRPDQTP